MRAACLPFHAFSLPLFFLASSSPPCCTPSRASSVLCVFSLFFFLSFFFLVVVRLCLSTRIPSRFFCMLLLLPSLPFFVSFPSLLCFSLLFLPPLFVRFPPLRGSSTVKLPMPRSADMVRRKQEGEALAWCHCLSLAVPVFASRVSSRVPSFLPCPSPPPPS